MGVRAKVWTGRTTLRGKRAELLRIQAKWDSGGDYRSGWRETWRLEETGEVLRYTRHSPSRDGWVLKAFGQHDGDWTRQWGTSAFMVAEVWARGPVSREDAFRLSGLADREP